MRDLTQQEIKSAPEWATHYFIAENYGIRWSNDSGYQWRGDEFHSISHGGATRLQRESKPIPRKSFDISESLSNVIKLALNDILIDDGTIGQFDAVCSTLTSQILNNFKLIEEIK